jgi:hypothetical protein
MKNIGLLPVGLRFHKVVKVIVAVISDLAVPTSGESRRERESKQSALALISFAENSQRPLRETEETWGDGGCEMAI